jgi:hypothetical protein
MKKSIIFLLGYLILLVNHAKTQTFTNCTSANTSTTLGYNNFYAIGIDAERNKWFGNPERVSKLSFKSTGLTPFIHKNSLQIYPNPVQGILHPDLSGKQVCWKSLIFQGNRYCKDKSEIAIFQMMFPDWEMESIL